VNLDLSTEQRADVIYAFLKAGVPPTAVATAMSVDVEYVNGALDLMHVDQYGTDSLPEAMSYLIWVAYEEALYQIRHGTPAMKAKFLQFVLARSIGLAGKSSPETSEKIRAALDQMTRDLAPPAQLVESIYEPDS
jgi:hypothetical protein